MDENVLDDPATFPSDPVLSGHLGPAKAALDAVLAPGPGITVSWRFYQDGKRWLCNVSHKKKTLCWISVCKGYFRVTCYFGDKAEPAILAAGLPASLLALYQESAGKKIRGITTSVQGLEDLETCQRLLAVKRLT